MSFNCGNLWQPNNKSNAFLRLFLSKLKLKSSKRSQHKSKCQLRKRILLKKWSVDNWTITSVIRTTTLTFSCRCTQIITLKNVPMHISRYEAFIYAKLPQNKESYERRGKTLAIFEIRWEVRYEKLWDRLLAKTDP